MTCRHFTQSQNKSCIMRCLSFPSSLSVPPFLLHSLSLPSPLFLILSVSLCISLSRSLNVVCAYIQCSTTMSCWGNNLIASHLLIVLQMWTNKSSTYRIISRIVIGQDEKHYCIVSICNNP